MLARRSDGYHEIETLFERIDLCDEIELVPLASGIRIETASKNIPRDFRNLAYRAADLLQKECKVKRGVLIRIQKNIPISAGLGGGSGNAATVLLGLNRLWKLKLSQKKLLSLAACLGSDVAFFVLDASFALGRGRGEILKKLAAPPKKIWHCLVKPPFGISTPAAYRALFLRKGQALTPQKSDVRMLLHSIQKGDSEALRKLLTNSLEPTLNKRVTDILEIKKELTDNGALGALMSGSGSCVFGIFSSRKKAASAAHFLKAGDPKREVFVAGTF